MSILGKKKIPTKAFPCPTGDQWRWRHPALYIHRARSLVLCFGQERGAQPSLHRPLAHCLAVSKGMGREVLRTVQQASIHPIARLHSHCVIRKN